jgi:hypothetical protein
MTLFKRFMTYFLLLSFFLFNLSGCGVSNKNEVAALELIHSKMPNFEANAQTIIKSNKDFNKLHDGKWSWDYKKGDDKKIIATYKYVGKLSWGKRIAGLGIGLLTLIVTFGYFFYNPWVGDETLGLSLEVNLENQAIKSLTH